MALRQAGRGAAQLLLLQARRGAAPLLPEAGPLGLHALALHAAAQRLAPWPPRGPPLPRLPLAASSPLAPWSLAVRGLQAPSDRKEDAAGKVPDAAECDEALAQYQEVRTSRRRPPSTYRTGGQRLKDALSAVVNGLIAVVRFTLGIPAALWALRLKSRAQWAADWASMKKTVKHEAHHYWKTVKHEAHHYWGRAVGTKLLATDVRIASGLAFKTMRGSTLTRRERRQLTRTTADIIRLVPMVIILVIPFMELALPLLLKLFPNMLPSTFEDQMKKEEDVKRRLVVKLEVARFLQDQMKKEEDVKPRLVVKLEVERFLQDTMAEMAKEIKSKRTGEVSASADELFQFINKVRAGAAVDAGELVKFARLFNDELTLDRLDRVQLVSMCQLLSIPPFGTDGFLRNRLRSHLEKIKQDDQAILAEGLDYLNCDELRSACRARGMRAVFGDGSQQYMATQMKGWLDLSQRGLPSSLLLLSRALVLTTPQPAATPEEAQLKGVRDTLLTLPEEVIQDVGLEVGGGGEADGPAELEKRLELIRKEQAMIDQEAQAAKAAAAEKEKEKEKKKEEQKAAAAAAAAPPAEPKAAEERERLADPAAAAEAAAAAAEAEAREAEAARNAAAVAAASAVIREAAAGAVKDAMGREADEALEDASKGVSAEERAAQSAAAREQRMQDVISALAVLASGSGVATERAAFMQLVKREVHRLQDTLGPQVQAQMLFTGGGLQAVRPEDEPEPESMPEMKAPLALEERVGGILTRIEKELDDAERAIGERLHVIDLDNDGLISKSELTEALRFLRANLDEDELMALLDRLSIKDRGGADQPLISVSELVKLAEGGSSGSSSGSGGSGGGGGSSSGGSSSGGGSGSGGGGAKAEQQPADEVKIHTR
ncbi:MAG: LETM1-domain-containing protein [Monoraphidium minutum]|nr:MAG: LETM1-domain-containing protein [Monoraphidium minutum]